MKKRLKLWLSTIHLTQRRVVTIVFISAILIWEFRGVGAAPEVSVGRVRALVALRDFAAGESATLRDFTFRLESKTKLPSDFISDQELFLVKGALIRRELKEGEYLTTGHLKSDTAGLTARIPHGARAYILRSEDRIPVSSGDSVDVFLSGGFTAIAEGLPVLRVRHEDKGMAVVVAAKVADIADLESAKARGKLVLALRNPDDVQRYQKKTARRQGQGARTIPIITEGLR